MTNDFWINLPVKDVNRSREFFVSLGFPLNAGPGNSDVSASFIAGNKNVVVMLFEEIVFKTFTGNETSGARATEVLFSIGAQSKDEVNEWATKVKNAGGTVFGEPKENQGWMYGCGFADLDGHRWNVLYMDMSKMPKG